MQKNPTCTLAMMEMLWNTKNKDLPIAVVLRLGEDEDNWHVPTYQEYKRIEWEIENPERSN